MELFSLLAKLTLDAKEYNSELNEAQRAADNFHSPDPQTLELDTSDYDTGISDSESLSTGFTSNVGSAFTELKGVIAASGVVLAVTGIVNSIKEAVNLTAETADAIDKGSKRLGISTDKYQEWDHALRQSGASITDLQKGVLQFNNYIAGDKTEEMSKAFKQLGIDADKAGTSTEQLINDTLIALAGFKGTSEERGVLVTTLFGKGGMNLNALLDEGEKGVKDLLEEADKLGLVMTGDEISNAVAYGDAVSNLQSELTAIKTAFVQDLVPVLKDATEWLTSLLQTFNPRLRENAISETFQQIDAESTKSLQTIKDNKTEAEALIDKLGEFGDFWTLTEDEKKEYESLVEELKVLYPDLDKLIDDNKTAIYENRDAILANIDAWSKLEQQRILDQNLADKQAAVSQLYAKALDKKIEANIKGAEAERYHAQAIEDLNDALKKEGMELLDENSTYQDFLIARSKLANKYAGRPNGELKFEEYRTIGSDYASVKEEEKALRQESREMYKDADEAKESAREYAEQLAREMGYTLSDTQQLINKFQELKQEMNSMPGGIRVSYEQPRGYTRAIGDAYIPYDNFPALLHRGERVITATEARQEQKATVDFTGLEDKIISAIKAGMDGAEVNSYLDGQLITDRVSKNLAGQLADRRYV